MNKDFLVVIAIVVVFFIAVFSIWVSMSNTEETSRFFSNVGFNLADTNERYFDGETQQKLSQRYVNPATDQLDHVRFINPRTDDKLDLNETLENTTVINYDFSTDANNCGSLGSCANIIYSGDNVSLLTNDAGYITTSDDDTNCDDASCNVTNTGTLDSYNLNQDVTTNGTPSFISLTDGTTVLTGGELDTVRIMDDFQVLSIDPNAKILYLWDGFTPQIDWSDTFNPNAPISIDNGYIVFNTDVMDTSLFNSWNPNNRLFYQVDGLTVSVDYSGNENNASNLSFDGFYSYFNTDAEFNGFDILGVGTATINSIIVGIAGNIISDDGANLNLTSRSDFVTLGNGTYYLSDTAGGSLLYLLNLARTTISLVTQGAIQIDSSTRGLELGELQQVVILFNGVNLLIDSLDVTANDKVLFTDFDEYNFDNNIVGSKNLTLDGNFFGNQIYGELNGKDTVATIGSSMIYYPIDDLNAGLLNGFTKTDANLIAVYGGVYSVVSQWSFSGGVTHEYHLSLHKNGTIDSKCHGERKLGTGGDVGSASYTCLTTLNAGDNIAPVIENVTAGTNAIIHDFQLIITRVGN